jgi:prophage antirepressor-like protein
MEIIPFNFETNNIRTFTDEFGNIWFVAKDVAIALEYPKFDSNIIKKIPDEWKDTKPIRTLGGIQELAVLLESGLYFFLARSDKPKAIPFQKWLAGEVLPTLRKTGTYSIRTPETPHQTFDIKFYTQQSREIFELVEFINSKSIKNLYFADKLYKTLNLHSPIELLKIDLKNYYLIPTELGHIINVSAVETNKILESRGLQIRENSVWHLTEKGQNFGIEVQSGSFIQIKWKIEAILN